MIKKSYDWVIKHADTPKAKKVLIAVAFAESSFFPIPPDPLYMAMILANHTAAWSLATICTLSSVIGGILGYYIGFALYESVGGFIINTYGLQESFNKFQSSFDKWGFWIVTLKGLTPIPYKIVTIFSGVVKLDLVTFIMASIIARGFRFFSVAALLRYCGPKVRIFVEKNLVLVTSLVLAGIVLGFLLLKFI